MGVIQLESSSLLFQALRKKLDQKQSSWNAKPVLIWDSGASGGSLAYYTMHRNWACIFVTWNWSAHVLRIIFLVFDIESNVGNKCRQLEIISRFWENNYKVRNSGKDMNEDESFPIWIQRRHQHRSTFQMQKNRAGVSIPHARPPKMWNITVYYYCWLVVINSAQSRSVEILIPGGKACLQ